MLNYLPESYLLKLTDQTPKHLDLKTELAIHNRLHPFGLDKLADNNEVVDLAIPEGFGSIDDELSLAYAPYKDRTSRLEQLVTSEAPTLPEHFQCPLGWSYWSQATKGWVAAKQFPQGRTFVLDAETVEVAPGRWHPTCMVAMSAQGWLVWRADLSKVEQVTVVPFSKCNTILGYNVSYDRSYLDVEYCLDPSDNQFHDLMSMWIVTNGMSNQQRQVYGKFAEEDEDTENDLDLSKPTWLQKTSTNGLAQAYKFYTHQELDKGVRDGIVDLGLSWVKDNMVEVIRYCALDVLATHELATHLYPAYKRHRPSETNRYGAVALGSCWVPLDGQRFPTFYERVEALYQSDKAELNQLLMEAATDFLSRHTSPTPQTSSLDWTTAKSGVNKGKPKWYRDCLSAYKGGLTLGQRWAPLILGMTWGGEPVLWADDKRGFYTDKHGLLPHPTRRGQPVGNMFLKDFADLHESGFIAVSGRVKALAAKKTSGINWVSTRKRIANIRTESPDSYPVTIPRMSPNGTVTGRATDPVWQVTANPKPNRIGTELKSMVAPFPGYSLVGADVDSQEAWLAACHGDEDLGFCGSTPFSMTTIAGSSKTHTDIHSVVAKQTGYSRDVTKTRVYGCVPLSTEALTKQGWKPYAELSIGDLILAYNPETKSNEWTEILNLSYYEDAPLLKLSTSHNYEHISTPNHRWYTTQRHRYDRDTQVGVVRTTETLVRESNIITSAYSVGGSSTLTVDEAAIVAWLITDGGIYWAKPTLKTSSSFGTKRGVQAHITQKKEPQVSLLRSLLAPYLTNIDYRKDSQCYVFRLKPQFVRDLWAKAGLTPEAENYVALVTELSQPARKAFLKAFWLAEGHTDKRGVKLITQNVGTELNCAVVAATLEGYGIRLSWKDADRKCQVLRLIERKHNTCQRLKKESVANAAVWCPTTALSTWVMRQGHTVTITGNSLYGQGVKGDSDVILKSDPTLSDTQAKIDSSRFISLFKGDKDYSDRKPKYVRGLASLAFTRMEEIADKLAPRTPLTKARMSNALAGINDYKPTRVNWIVQSSGVDFRDMLVLLTLEFYRRFGVRGRLVLTIHDEVRTMVKDEDITKAVYALQLAHLYTRAAFIRAHGLNDIPAGLAWFSAVDVDNVCLRKNPTDPQVTPTQTALPLGYTINPQQLKEMLDANQPPNRRTIQTV